MLDWTILFDFSVDYQCMIHTHTHITTDILLTKVVRFMTYNFIVKFIFEMNYSDATSVNLGTCQTELHFWLPAYYLGVVLANFHDMYLHSTGCITNQYSLCIQSLQLVT